MKTVTINNFSGGVVDPRETLSNTASSARHFLLGKTKLEPYRDMETEALDTGTLADYDITNVIRYNYTGTSQTFFALGHKSGQTPAKIFEKTTDTPSSNFQASTSGEDTTGVVIEGSLIGYKGALYFLKTLTGNTVLCKYVYGGPVSDIGTIGASPTGSTSVVPQMFIHPKDGRLYMASGSTMGVYDGTTLTTRGFSSNHNINAITYLGSNIVIGMTAKDSNNSVLGLWDGSLTSSVLTDVVEFGNDTLLILENLGDVVVGVSTISVGGASDVGTENNVIIRGYNGGTTQILRTIQSKASTNYTRVYARKAKKNNILYFPASIHLNGTRTYQIYAFYKNELGQWVLTPDRKPFNNTELVNEDITSVSTVGDYMWVSFKTSSATGKLYRTNDNEVYTSTSSYETTVNPNMEVSDKSKKKQLKAVSLRCGSPSGATHTVTLSYSVDGGAFNTIYTGSSSSIVRVIEEVGQSDYKQFLEAREYIFKIETTGNGEIYELKYAYEVKPTLI